MAKRSEGAKAGWLCSFIVALIVITPLGMVPLLGELLLFGKRQRISTVARIQANLSLYSPGQQRLKFFYGVCGSDVLQYMA